MHNSTIHGKTREKPPPENSLFELIYSLKRITFIGGFPGGWGI